MAENYGPLSLALVKSLTDKLYEKRKAAALEVEKLIREFLSADQTSQVEKVVDVLGDLARSQNPHNRKGGLIGLAAAAIALGKMSANYTEKLILPVLDCFNDSDARVRYYACEALYNIVKVTKESTLPIFSELFDTLCRICADTDQNVRSGSELLDRLLKDIVAGSKNFDVPLFMVLVRERIYTKTSSVKRFIVSWLNALYSVPGIALLPFIPEILDGLFLILSDPTQKIREICETVLGQFLKSIKENPDEVELKNMVNVLVHHAQAQEALVQHIALLWLQEFLALKGSQLLNFASGVLTAVLPCLAMTEDSSRDIHDVAKCVNITLMKLVGEEGEKSGALELKSVVEILQKHLEKGQVQSRVASLKWIHHIYQKMPSKVFPYMEQLFPVLLKKLSDESDEVVLLDLEVLSDLCQGKSVESTLVDFQSLKLSPETKNALPDVSPYFVKFVMSLLETLRKDLVLLGERASFIIRQLCLLLKPEDIFRTLAVLLCADSDLLFVSKMVQTMNGILLTATEVFHLRNEIRNLEGEHCRNLFINLYRCWCHQPVAVLSLCLLSQNYVHAAQLIHLYSDLEVTVDFLIEIDRLIQLLESPIFAYLRLHLLDPAHQPHLSAVLYGLLMLLPQTEAFKTLNARLKCIPRSLESNIMVIKDKKKQKAADEIRKSIPFDELLKYFESTIEKHKQFRRLKHRELLSKAA